MKAVKNPTETRSHLENVDYAEKVMRLWTTLITFQREPAETNAVEILQNLDCTIKYRFFPLCSNTEYREREKERKRGIKKIKELLLYGIYFH